MIPHERSITSVLLPGESDETRGPVRVRALLGGALRFTALGLVVWSLFFNLSVVRGSSMTPGIHDGDRILVDHLSYLFQDVHRGDVVILRCPLDPSLDYVKRVIGLPGDEVRIEDGRVCVNGELLPEPYIADPDPRTRLVERVAPDHFFVLGDNRPHSSDSREFGEVPRRYLRGRVEVRVWPPGRFGVLP